MSRILRRPMFRGGRVDGRGTGITTGLMDGGRVGFYRGGGTSYLPQQQTGSQILGRNIGNKDFSRSGITGFSFGDLFKTVPITSQGYGEFDPIKKSRERQGIEEVAYDEFDFVEPMYVDGKINPRYVEENPSNKNPRYVSTDPENISVDESLTASVEEGLPTSTVEEEPSTEPKATILTPKVNEPDTEVTMTDLERALGLDGARKEYVGDALAAASKAFFEGKGMGAIADAAAVKSKAPDIKRLAGLEQFKADSRQKMYETKLKQGKVFAPSNTQKLINTFKKVDEGSQAHGLALLDNKLAPTIEGQIKTMTNADPYKSAPSAAEVIGYMQFYHPDTYKGVISADTPPTEDGTYILEDASAILFVKDGKTSIKKLK